MNKNKQFGVGFGRRVALSSLALTAMVGSAFAAGENAGADVVITQINGLVAVAALVVGAAILVVVVPWGAKMAVKAFKSIGGA